MVLRTCDLLHQCRGKMVRIVRAVFGANTFQIKDRAKVAIIILIFLISWFLAPVEPFSSRSTGRILDLHAYVTSFSPSALQISPVSCLYYTLSPWCDPLSLLFCSLAPRRLPLLLWYVSILSEHFSVADSVARRLSSRNVLFLESSKALLLAIYLLTILCLSLSFVAVPACWICFVERWGNVQRDSFLGPTG